MKYSASPDSVVKIITTFTILLLMSITVKCIYDLMHSNVDMATVLSMSLVILLMPGIIILTYLYSPQCYILNASDLEIKRFINSKLVHYSEIAEVRSMEKEELRGIIRIFGVGGLFGYFGKFRNGKLGTMNFYATQSKNKILIILKSGDKIVITPDDIGIIEKIQSSLVQ